MKSKINKANEHIHNLFLQNFLVSTPDNSSKLSEQDLLKLSRIFKKGRSEKHFVNYLKHKKLTHFSNYKYLKSLSDARTLKSLQIIEASIKILKLFNSNKIDCIPLKGAQLIFFYNQSPSIRPMRDLDILINESQIDDAVRLLLQNGFFFESKANIQNDYKSSINKNRYDIEHIVNDQGVCIELHYKIFPKSVCSISKVMWDNYEKSFIKDIQISRLPPEILSLHFIYHSTTKEGFDVGVQALYDLYHIFSQKDFDFTKLLTISNKVNLLEETSIFIKIFEKYNKFSFKPEVLNNLYQIDDGILEECTKLLIINNASNHSIRIFRYGVFNLFKKNFKISTLNGEVFYKKNKFEYISIFFKRFRRNIYRLIPIFYKLFVDKSFLHDNLKTVQILRKIKK